MATVDITQATEADIRGLGLDLAAQIGLTVAIITALSYMPARFPLCPSAGPAAHKYHEGPFLVVFDVSGTPESVLVLQVLAARGRLAAMAVTPP